jgi:hypothetical protein
LGVLPGKRRLSSRGKDTAASISGAKLSMIEGMGHALPIPMWPQIIDAIDKYAHATSVEARHDKTRRTIMKLEG